MNLIGRQKVGGTSRVAPPPHSFVQWPRCCVRASGTRQREGKADLVTSPNMRAGPLKRKRGFGCTRCKRGTGIPRERGGLRGRR